MGELGNHRGAGLGSWVTSQRGWIGELGNLTDGLDGGAG